ncbi:hypothetical protein ADK67_03315 [Saccharothrix sp. NRRL B-16348]|nr:hypothetical protein ADK67_03315 [Saccharothrix sp. NRRL B-16348]
MKPGDETTKQAGRKSVHLQATASEHAQVVQVGGDQHNYYGSGVRGARRADSGSTDGECPYPGLSAFGPEHARWFFGRDALIAELVESLDHRQRSGGIQMVVAPSGAGKSSLLRAGLLPRLEKSALPGSSAWPRLLFTPTSDPLTALAEQVVPLVGDHPGVTAAELAADPARCVDAVTRASGDGHVLVVVDQFEELFTLCPDENRRRTFTEVLDRLARGTPSALVVLGVRADFYAACANDHVLRGALRDSPLVIGPLSEDELREAVLYPAQDVGLTVEPGLAELLLHDLGASGSAAGYDVGRLPLLAHALRTTWQQREGKALTVGGYRATGGIEGAVARSADRVYTSLDTTGRHLCRLMFPRLVRIGEGTEDTRRRLARAELLEAGGGPGEASAVLAAFTAARLLVQREDTVEITHEALVRAWPALRRWIEEDRAGLLVHQRLGEAAATWERENRDPGALYRGKLLADANVVADDPTRPLTALEREFVAVSGRAQQRNMRRLRSLVIVLSIAILTALGSGVGAYLAASTAFKLRDLDNVRGAIRHATDAMPGNSALASHLSVAAFRIHPNSETLSGLLSNAAAPVSTRVDHTDDVKGTSIGHEGQTLAVIGTDGVVTLWDISDPNRPRDPVRLTDHDSAAWSVSFNRTLMATGSLDGTVALWSAANRKAVTLAHVIRHHSREIKSVALSMDGRFLAVGSRDHTTTLWDVRNPQNPILLHSIRQSSDGANVAFSHDSKLVVTAGLDGTATLWETIPGDKPVKRGVVTMGDRPITSVTFSPHRRTLAVGTKSEFILWTVDEPAAPVPIGSGSDGTQEVSSIAFSSDRIHLATSNNDSSIRLWDITDPASPNLVSLQKAHSAPVNSVAISADTTLIAGADDETITLWDLTTVGPSHSGWGLFLRPSHNGTLLAVGGSDGILKLWDSTNPRRLKPLSTVKASDEMIGAIAFSQDDLTMVTSGHGGLLKLWNIVDPKAPVLLDTALATSDREVGSISFTSSPDHLVAGTSDGKITLWTIEDGNKLVEKRTLEQHAGSVTRVALARNADGRELLAAVGNGVFTLWDITDLGNPFRLAALTRNTSDLWGVHFSPDGSLLAIGGGDGRLWLWDVRNPEEPAVLGGALIHPAGISAIAFNPSGTHLAASTSGPIVLWDVKNPHAPARMADLTGHNGHINVVDFASDGHTLISSGRDRAIRTWETDPDTVAARICATVPSHLTETTWPTYFPTSPYREHC